MVIVMGTGERAGSILQSVLLALLVAAAIAAGSILVFRTTLPRELPMSSDGYYELRTAWDYERFWHMVRAGENFIQGRLMGDIYLNDLADFGSWGEEPPLNQSFGAKLFKGDFDGNGYAVYGIYSENGYGIVEENRGRIHDLSIKKSLITGDSAVGGICRQNHSYIGGCTFGGVLRTLESNPDSESRMAGICTENMGLIENCGYRGRMEITFKWTEEGTRAGICARNMGDIERCYNLSKVDGMTGEGKCLAIADAGEKSCFMLRDAGFDRPSGQVITLSEQQMFYLPSFLRRDICEMYLRSGDMPECLDQTAEMMELPDERRKKEVLRAETAFKADEETEQENAEWGQILSGGIQVKDGRILRQHFPAEDLIDSFLQEIFLYKRKKWTDVVLEMEPLLGNSEGPAAGQEKSGVNPLFRLRISDQKDEVGVAVYSCEEIGSEEYEQLWQFCGGLLGEEESWQHHTWQLLGLRDQKPRGSFILYRTCSGEAGFFYIEEGMVCQVTPGRGAKDCDLELIRDEIAGLADQWEKEEKETKVYYTLRESLREVPERLRTHDELWEIVLWSLWVNRLPGDGCIWRDEEVRSAVYHQAAGYGGDIPTREEVAALEELRISEPECVKTLGDLANMPLLSRLSVAGSEGTRVNCDLEAGSVLQLTELSLTGVIPKGLEKLQELPGLRKLQLMECGLRDISFLEKLPALEEISLYGNHIRDISPLSACRNLEILSLACNEVEDISTLALLSGLKEAGLQYNEIRDIEPLKELLNLTKLNLTCNHIGDLSALETKTNIEALGLGGNEIKDITPLRGMTEMYNLALDYNRIEDITPLEGMEKMEYLGLSGNRIQSYDALKGMKKLFYLSAADNPAQDMGDLVFVPMLGFGGMQERDQDRIAKAQRYLDIFYPDEEIEAEDIARGDLNGDGIEDMAVTGMTGEQDAWDRERSVYPFLGKADGSFEILPPVESLGPGQGGVYGDPYQGILITGKKLVVQCIGGSSYRWETRKIYQMENDVLRERWQLDLDGYAFAPGYDFTVYDRAQETCRYYAVVGDWEGPKEMLLLDEGQVPRKLQRRIDQKLSVLSERTGWTLPEISRVDTQPQVTGNAYEYRFPDYQVSAEPEKVLEIMAGQLLEDPEALPVLCYTSNEIKESYDRLTGVELPENFYIGFGDGDPKMLLYSSCEPDEEEGFVHTLILRSCSGEDSGWEWDSWVYYYEKTGAFVVS